MRQKRKRQGRPMGCRYVQFNPRVKYFKPRGIPLQDLEEINLTKEEVEVLRLKNIKGLDQTACAQAMKTSQSTLQRILSSAYHKISRAIIEGKAIKIDDK